MKKHSLLGDEELLKHLSSGDEQAFSEIYNRYWEQLLAIGLYFTHQKQAAEDIVHDVFMSLWIRRKTIVIESLKTYLATAVKFAVFKAISKDKRQREILTNKLNPFHFTEIEENLDQKFLKEYLQGVVEKLPDKARIVFIQSREEELTIKQIAENMDLSPKAVEYHMTKALRVLKEAVNKIKLFSV